MIKGNSITASFAPTRILVIQTAFIGDVILATSLLETIHQGISNAQIDVMVRKGNEGLFKEHPFIKKIYVWDKKGGKYKSLLSALKVIRSVEYDIVINLQRYGTTGILTALSKAKTKIGFDKNPFAFTFTIKEPHVFKKGIHETDRNYNLVKSLVQIPKSPTRLYPSQEDYNSASPYKTEKYICIAPTSVWYTKQFPKEKWIELIGHLPQELTIYLVGAPSDHQEIEAIMSQISNRKIQNLAGKLSLLQSAALFKDAERVFVNDSAPMHLCSSVDAKVTVIYCSTVPEFGYGPTSTDSIVIESSEKLACRPCGLHGHKSCPEKHFKCATSINTSKVY